MSLQQQVNPSEWFSEFFYPIQHKVLKYIALLTDGAAENLQPDDGCVCVGLRVEADGARDQAR